MDELYIPGDLVFHYIPKTTIRKYVKVYVCSTNNALSLEDMDGKLYDYIGVLYPIPLTPEILEKNGWEPTKESLGHSFKNKKYPRFALWSINDKFNFTIDGVTVCNTLSCLCYVHELQHLLFGLNINHEMEV